MRTPLTAARKPLTVAGTRLAVAQCNLTVAGKPLIVARRTLTVARTGLLMARKPLAVERTQLTVERKTFTAARRPFTVARRMLGVGKCTLDRMRLAAKSSRTSMQRAQFNRTEMFNTTAAVMAENSGLWSGIPAIVQTMTELNANIAQIGTKMMHQQTPITGAAVDKAQVRHDFEEKLLWIADQVAALAAANHDMTLAAQADLTLSSLDRMADDALEETGVLIASLVLANQSALEDYGIVGDDLADLNTLITQFHDAKTKPRTAAAARKGETDTLPDLIRNTTSLLRNRLDKQMTRFRSANPVFFASYRSARVVVDRGTPPPPAPTPPTPPGP